MLRVLLELSDFSCCFDKSFDFFGSPLAFGVALLTINFNLLMNCLT
jgi:hypothetical protein